MAENNEAPTRSRHWLPQAVRDLEQAQDSRRGARYEWVCFAAHQAVEKAMHLHLGQEAWGHVVAQLFRELPNSLNPGEDLVERGRVLDIFYIPPRCPSAHPEGAPFEHYGPLQSQEAVQYAGEIIEFVRSQVARRQGGG